MRSNEVVPRRAAQATRRGRIPYFIVAMLCAGLLASSCASPRDSLGTNQSPCFRALGVARQSVHGHGRYAGVRLFSISALEHALSAAKPHAVAVPASLNTRVGSVCLVFYSGRFTKKTVTSPWPPSTTRGQVAIVVVPLDKDKVNVTFLVPRSFVRSTHVFPVL